MKVSRSKRKREAQKARREARVVAAAPLMPKPAPCTPASSGEPEGQCGNARPEEESEEAGPVEDGPMTEERLRQEAVSTHHLVTRLPKNKFCDACAKCKTTKRRCSISTRRSDPPCKFGEKVTVDFLIACGDDPRGLGEELVDRVILDICARMRWCAPAGNRTDDNVVEAFAEFVGPRRLQSVRSDNGIEIGAACRKLGVPNPTGTPRVSQTSGVVERVVRHVEDGPDGSGPGRNARAVLAPGVA